MNKKNLSIGVLLINLGTPDSPNTLDVRKYLKEFLSDKRILEVFWLFRILLLYLIILPFRSSRSAELYKKIWTKEGSPLLVWGKKSRDKLAEELGSDYNVKLSMRYGTPNIASSLDAFHKENVEKIVVVPLFPQYAAGTTGSIMEAVSANMNKNWHITPYEFIGPFYNNPHFVKAHAERIEAVKKEFNPEFFLFSYHGLPVDHLKKAAAGRNESSCMTNPDCCKKLDMTNNFCYRAQCFETSRLIITESNLPKDKTLTTFQSRFGRKKWLTPDIQTVLPALAEKGIRKIAVVCPGFVADCLETLEEIALRLKEEWISVGGEDLVLVESLNDNHNWILCLKEIVTRQPIIETESI